MAGRAGALPVTGRAPTCAEAPRPDLLRLALREAVLAPDLERGQGQDPERDMMQAPAAARQGGVLEWGRVLAKAARPEAAVPAVAVPCEAALRAVAVQVAAVRVAVADRAANADRRADAGTFLRPGPQKGRGANVARQPTGWSFLR
jgi:hypothetical protein